MPIYEYQCVNCGAIEEALQKVTDKPLTKCRQCSGKLHKLISQSAFHLKGTGWYVTDYAGKTQNKEPNKDPGVSEKSTAGGQSKSPAKAKADSD